MMADQAMASPDRPVSFQAMSAPERRADQQRLTLDEFLQLPEEDAYKLELVRGLVVREPRPGSRHGQVCMILGAALYEYAKAHGLGAVMVDTGFVLSREEHTLRGPDLSFVSARRIGYGVLQESMFEGAPDLAVEVLSPSNRAGEVRQKVADYLGAGCRLVWVVDPRRRRVTMHEPGKATSSLKASDTLDGAPVLPGFRLALIDLFGS